MATRFLNSIATNVGTTEAVVYTSPVGEKSIVIGCNAANKTGAILPISLVLRSAADGTDSYIIKNLRVGNGESAELMKGNKLVLQSEDQILAITADNNAFDVILSVLIGVS